MRLVRQFAATSDVTNWKFRGKISPSLSDPIFASKIKLLKNCLKQLYGLKLHR